MTTPETSRKPLVWWGSSWIALGAALRLWGLPRQVMGGDELHAVRIALTHPLGEILTTYFPTDNSIPLTAAYRVVLGLGVPLSEMLVRLPILAAGLLFLLLGPIAVARLTDRPTAAAFVALVAIYPPFVFYSRFARSYMPMTLLAFLAVWAFFEWWRRGGRCRAIAAALGAATAVYLHLGAGPFVASPFLFAGLAKLRGRGDRSWGEILALGGGTAGAVATVISPAGASLLRLIGLKRVEREPGVETLVEASRLLSGTTAPLLTVVFWLLAGLGAAILWRRDRDLAELSLVLVGGHAVGLRILSPLGLDHPLVLSRYLLVAAPVLLLLVAVGLSEPWRHRRERDPWRVAVGVATLFVAGLLATSPVFDRRFLHGSFAHHNDTLWFTRIENRMPHDAVPDFYRRLARSGTDGAVVEYPWLEAWSRNRTFDLYQAVHGRDVLVAPVNEVYWDPRLAFRNTVVPDLEPILASRARYLVVHRDVATEEERVTIPDPRGRRTGLGRRARRKLRGVPDLVRRLRDAWGPPIVDDGTILVWDLGALREGS